LLAYTLFELSAVIIKDDDVDCAMHAPTAKIVPLTGFVHLLSVLAKVA
jgi:hypothetical protein